jgi:hypothetical protein
MELVAERRGARAAAKREETAGDAPQSHVKRVKE